MALFTKGKKWYILTTQTIKLFPQLFKVFYLNTFFLAISFQNDPKVKRYFRRF